MSQYGYITKLQFPLLREFFALAKDQLYCSVEEASSLDQRPFGSLYHRGWIGYKAGKGFYATKEGRAAYEIYMGEARRRAHPEAPLSHYFDPVAYQLDHKTGSGKKKKQEPRRSMKSVRERVREIRAGAA
jgi:3-hydroxyacyl-CoA dehydrogenase